MKLATLLLAGTTAAALVFGSGAAHATPSPQPGVCPAIGTLGTATDCNVELFFGAGGSATSLITHATPYDGSDDALVGIINNSGATITQLSFSGSTFAGGLFAFDNDGLQTFGSGLGNDPTGYGGKTSLGEFTTFTAISADKVTGTVVFGASGIPNGGTAYFSLEGPPNVNIVPITTPEPASLMLLGVGLISLGGVAYRRRRKLA